MSNSSGVDALRMVNEMDKKRGSDANDAWHKCAPGLLTRLTDRATTERRRDFLIKASTGSILAVGAFLALSRSLNRPEQVGPTPRLVSCQTVQQNLSRFIKRELDDPELVASISQHLRYCGHCRQDYKNRVTA